MFRGIIPIEQIVGYAVNKAVSGVQYHWGDSYELQKYLRVGKGMEQMNSFGGDYKQYPLIWLVKPFMTAKLPDGKHYRVNRMRLLFSLNNQNMSELNTEREKSFDVLVPLANDLLKFFTKSSIAYFPDRRNPEFSFDRVPNYSVQNKSGAVDIWDALVLEMDLIVNSLCVDFDDFKCDFDIINKN